MVPSFSVRDTRRFPCSQAISRPCRSSVSPFVPIWTPAGNSPVKDRFAKNREFSRRSPLHDRVGGNIAEQQVSAVAQPDWPFREQEIADYFLDGRSYGNEFVQRRVETADASYAAELGSERQNCACARQYGKKLPFLHKPMLSPAHADRLNCNRQSDGAQT